MPIDPPTIPASVTNSRFLVLLSPPRSFSSVVSTMIGQHPDLYGFPELHLFIGDTVQEVLDREYRAGNHFAPLGLLRAIAELESGVQTTPTITKAFGWLVERRHWSTKHLMDYLRARVMPRIAMEKSPITALQSVSLERVWAYYPHAHFLHLTRHPVSTRRSMEAYFKDKVLTKELAFDGLLFWFRFHRNILEFTRTLPPGQSLMIKGEALLSEPDLYLPQIAEWLGLRTDAEAIEAMKHPERSPFAYWGPAPAFGGNDSNFLRDPVLRPGRVKEPSLSDFFARGEIDWVSAQDRDRLAEAGYRLAPTESLIEDISALAHRLGYH